MPHIFGQRKTLFSSSSYAEDDSLKTVYLETFGCQMNFNDSEIVLGILKEDGWQAVKQPESASLVLLMTCAIREGAESKIWQRIDYFKSLKSKLKYSNKFVLGILGCMAERLKERLIESEKRIDLVCGPDSYRQLPMLVKVARNEGVGIEVMFSLDETYADVSPVRLNPSGKSAFVSIMRGCNNMCSFCIVPFVRGRERSRPFSSIYAEIEGLAAEGIKEVTLLGQNVNSYRGPFTVSNESITSAVEVKPSTLNSACNPLFSVESMLSVGKGMTSGFKSVYHRKENDSEISFTVLLDILAQAFPSIRFRFTSPHPKDFPTDLLDLINRHENICKTIHLPAQSGSTTVLQRMRRGYSRDAYLALVDNIYRLIPGVAITSDFIVGFCNESDSEHEESLSLLRQVNYDMAYMFAYSMRERTHAHRNYEDNVAEEVKQGRLREMLDLFYGLQVKNSQKYLHTRQQVLVLSESSKKDATMCTGKTDSGRPCVFYPPHGRTIEEMQGELVDVVIEKIQGGTLVGRAVKHSKSVA